MVALSFVQTPEDVESVREHTRLPLIAKMEKPQAVERAAEILEAADYVMVARGDLGIELPIAAVPIVQKQLPPQLAALDGAPVDHRDADARLDGQLLPPHPRRGRGRGERDPRRDGRRDALGETAVGPYPVEAVAMMAAVAEQAESIAPYERWNQLRVHRTEFDPAYTIAHNLCDARGAAPRRARRPDAVRPLRSTRLRPPPIAPIYALSPGKDTVRRCCLMWGVQAASIPRHETTEAPDRTRRRRVVELGWCETGQRVGSPPDSPPGGPGPRASFQIQAL